MTLEDEARALFAEHYNCAQSVFVPLARRLEMDPDLAFRIATPFGGGISHTGQVCGAVSGALMAIGLARGITTVDREKKYACYHLAQSFLQTFESLHDDVTCPALIGFQIGVPSELAQAKRANVFHDLCPVYVADAVRIASGLILKHE
jgi:C_GCAxxG_C_C family probable redox protein